MALVLSKSSTSTRKARSGLARLAVSNGPWRTGAVECTGGLSTGWKTDEGARRAIKAMVEGRRKWVERMKADGGKFPCGRKPGADWITPKMREKAAAEAKRLGFELPPDTPKEIIGKLSDLASERERLERPQRRTEKVDQIAAVEQARATLV